MIPMTLARSSTENGIGRPRIFSAIAQKMWPPSSGRNGKRLMTPSDSEMSARIRIACVVSKSKDCRVAS